MPQFSKSMIYRQDQSEGLKAELEFQCEMKY